MDNFHFCEHFLNQKKKVNFFKKNTSKKQSLEKIFGPGDNDSMGSKNPVHFFSMANLRKMLNGPIFGKVNQKTYFFSGVDPCALARPVYIRGSRGSGQFGRRGIFSKIFQITIGKKILRRFAC